MAGWIAFRYLKDSGAAEPHFKDLPRPPTGR